MDPFIKSFIRASLLWFLGGILLGLAIAIHPEWTIYRPAHAHMNVAGFLTFLVFGVGYQLLPRLFGSPLASRRMAIAHLWLANIGLAGMVLGFFLQPWNSNASRWLLSGGGLLYAAGALLWIWNLWQTFNAADERQRQRELAGRKDLPTVD